MLVVTEFGLIPSALMDDIENYVDNGDTPFGVLVPALLNDLRGFHSLADVEEISNVKAIMAFIEWRVPENCRGSVSAIYNYVDSVK